jgi:hypothetical protein
MCRHLPSLGSCRTYKQTKCQGRCQLRTCPPRSLSAPMGWARRGVPSVPQSRHVNRRPGYESDSSLEGVVVPHARRQPVATAARLAKDALNVHCSGFDGSAECAA